MTRTRKADSFDRSAQRQLCISLTAANHVIDTAIAVLKCTEARHPDVADTIREWIAKLNTIEDEIEATAKPLSPTARMRRVG